MSFVVYLIQNAIADRVYVGYTSDFDKRMSNHFGLLARGAHHSIRLQRAWNRDGAQAFTARSLKVLPTKGAALMLEQSAMYLFGADLYNMVHSNSPAVAMKKAHSKAARARSLVSRRNSPRAMAALAEARKKSRTPEAIAKQVATARRNGTQAPRSMPVKARHIETNAVRYFKSGAEAARALGLESGNVAAVCNGKRSHAGGYALMYWLCSPIPQPA